MENPTQYIRKYSDKFIFREDIWRSCFDSHLYVTFTVVFGQQTNTTPTLSCIYCLSDTAVQDKRLGHMHCYFKGSKNLYYFL